MSINNSIAVPNLSQFQEKKEVTDTYWVFLWCLAFLVVLGNALFNCLYGASQGTTLTGVFLTGGLFFLGDACLLALSYYTLPRQLTQVFCWVSVIGFALLSMFSAAAFLLGQQHEMDSNREYIEERQAYIAELRQSLSKIDPSRSPGNHRRLRTEIQKEQESLDSVAEVTGGRTSGASAIYHFIAKVFVIPVELVSLAVRLSWSFIFVIGSLALGGMLASCFSPMSIRSWAKHQEKKAAAMASLRSDSRTVKTGPKPLPRSESGTPAGVVHSPAPSGKGTGSGKVRGGASFDTGTEGGNATRYGDVKKQVQLETLKPSVKSLKTLGMGTATAQNYLKKLADDGVIYKHGQGYKLAQ